MFEAPRKKGMSLIILDILRNEKLHGYGIAERIEEIYGIERPSSGLIYPILSSLQRNRLVRICKRGTREKKIYEITPRGLSYLEEHAEEVKRSKEFLRRLGEFHRIGGHELMESIKLLITEMDSLDEEDRKKLGEILKNTARKIRFIVEFGEEQ